MRNILTKILAGIRNYFQNPLILLVSAQFSYVTLGISFLDFNISPFSAFIAVLSSALTELVLANKAMILRRNTTITLFMPWSALAAGFGIAIFLRALNPWYFALAGIVAIASKYIIRIPGRHIFNPSNFAIVSFVILFPSETTVELTQWGSNPIVHFIIAAVSFFIAFRAGVFGTTLSFLASYTLLLTVALSYASTALLTHHYGLLGPSLVLFSSFMITDPKTAPTGFYGRILHGISTAFMFFFLETMGVRYSLFIALFTITILNAITTFTLLWLHRKMSTPNIISFTVTFVLLCAGLLTIPSPQQSFKLTPPSLSFLLFGVESRTSNSCSAKPLFTVQENVGFRPHHSVYGIAWGDYNNDKSDDLVVSDSYLGRRLYKNDGKVGFTDVTESVGLSTQAFPRSSFFMDFNNDGLLDLFEVFSKTGKSPGPLFSMGEKVPVISVYQNNKKYFSDVSEQLGLSTITDERSLGTLSFGDYDNDGYLDMVVTEYGKIHDINSPTKTAFEKNFFDPMYRFTQVWQICDPEKIREIFSKRPDILKQNPHPIDMDSFYEKGGCLQIPMRLNVFSNLTTTSRIFDHRDIHTAYLIEKGTVRLFRNEAGYRFTEIPEFRKNLEGSLKKPPQEASFPGKYPYEFTMQNFYQPTSFDFDEDGDIDIFISVDHGRNVLLRNEGGFRFKDISDEAGFFYSSFGMGTDISDFNNDGKLDIISTNKAEDYLFENKGNGVFENNWQKNQIGTLGTGWGVSFLDYNLDGWDDLFITNGDANTSSQNIRRNLTRALFRKDEVYENQSGIYQNATESILCPDENVGRALAISDYDNDGDPDAVIGNIKPVLEEKGVVLYKNNIANKNYLKIHLRGTISNRMGVGSVVRVKSKHGTQTKTLLAGNSFYSQNSQALIFGFNEDSSPVQVEVTWPSGIQTIRDNTKVNQTIEIIEGL